MRAKSDGILDWSHVGNEVTKALPTATGLLAARFIPVTSPRGCDGTEDVSEGERCQVFPSTPRQVGHDIGPRTPRPHSPRIPKSSLEHDHLRLLLKQHEAAVLERLDTMIARQENMFVRQENAIINMLERHADPQLKATNGIEKSLTDDTEENDSTRRHTWSNGLKHDAFRPVQKETQVAHNATASRYSTASLQPSIGFGKYVKGPNFSRTSLGTVGELEGVRLIVSNIQEHWVTQSISVFLILLTVLLIIIDTDSRAEGQGDDQAWETVAMAVCFVAYCIETLASLYVQGSHCIYYGWNYVDTFVICASVLDYVMLLVNGGRGFELLRLLRICRLLRLGRLLRALKLLQRVGWLKEQYTLCMMMASCFRTLCWAFALCIFTMTLWSILAVELMGDLVVELAEKRPLLWEGCERCPRSFSTVWASNWTFFQTIVAGDSWGQMALPLIEEHWWTAFIFVGALATIIFGILNLITAVVIDSFAERRSKDFSTIGNELEYEELQAKKKLFKMFPRIDEDSSGALSLAEVRAGAASVPEFRHLLRVLDIDGNDLEELFDMIDLDKDGQIDPSEWVEAIYRLQNTQSKTATRLVKHRVAKLTDKQNRLNQKIGVIQNMLLAANPDNLEVTRLMNSTNSCGTYSSRPASHKVSPPEIAPR